MKNLVKEQYIEDESEYFKNLNQAKEELKDKKEKIKINPKLKEYAIKKSYKKAKARYKTI